MMPLYDFRCEEHGRWEVLAKANETRACPSCGVEGVRMISLPAKTATLWNSGWNSGLGSNGFYSASAGQRVSDKREEERIMNARGFINEKELGGESFYQRQLDKNRDERNEAAAAAKTWTDNLKKFDGDKTRAMTETYPAHEMLKQAYEHDAKESA
jgi:putative FmdB family regulatory protein